MSPSEASDIIAIMPARSESYNFSDLTSEASFITGIMSLKGSDDLLLVPEQI